jgi:tetrahydrodipicolinate N-succinyltransferase
VGIALGVIIGPCAMIAVGAVVTRDVAVHVLVAGSPARSYEHGPQDLAAIPGGSLALALPDRLPAGPDLSSLGAHEP